MKKNILRVIFFLTLFSVVLETQAQVIMNTITIDGVPQKEVSQWLIDPEEKVIITENFLDENPNLYIDDNMKYLFQYENNSNLSSCIITSINEVNADELYLVTGVLLKECYYFSKNSFNLNQDDLPECSDDYEDEGSLITTCVKKDRGDLPECGDDYEYNHDTLITICVKKDTEYR